MSCTNCYNGCVEIVSDKCVRYTGDSIPSLEIASNSFAFSPEIPHL